METVKKLERIHSTDPHVRGVLAYVKFGIKLLNCHIGEQGGADATSRDQAVIDASFACSFVLYWRWRIGFKLKPLGFTLKRHFLTRETFLDVLTLTQTRRLMALLYREFYPMFKIHGPNVA